MKVWNFGIIGTGLIAGFHAKAIQDIPNANLIGCCDMVPELAEKFAKENSCEAFKSLDELLQNNEIDIVTIATPSGAHMEPVVAAAEAGKHVISEKPMEITLERIDKMIEAHQKAGTVLGGVFQYRYEETIQVLKNAIDEGRFGKMSFAGAFVPWWRTDEYYEGWHGTWKLDGGGALMNQSIHMIDLLCYLAPPIESIQAFSATIGHPQIETEDTSIAALKFENGMLGTIYGTTASFPGQFKRLEFTGTKGTVVYLEDSFAVWEFADKKPEDDEIIKKFGELKGDGAKADPAAISFQNHKKNFIDFLKSLEDGTDFALNGQEARKAVEVILAIYRSSKEQKLVKI